MKDTVQGLGVYEFQRDAESNNSFGFGVAGPACKMPSQLSGAGSLMALNPKPYRGQNPTKP